METPIRWGLVGCGDIAEKRVAPALQHAVGSKLLACSRKQPARLLEFQQRHGIPKGVPDPAEIFADPEIDAVYLATPVFLHCVHTIEAAEHGKHVLCEKPMAMDAAECQRMVDACRSHGVKLGIAYYRRFYPVVQKIQELLRTEALGKVILVRTTLVSPTSLEPAAWRFVPDQGGGGLLMDMVSHRLDLLCMLFGQPLSVSALTATRELSIPVEDTGSLLIQFSSGVHAAVFASHCIHAEMDDFEIYGTRGSLRVSPLNGSELKLFGAADETFHLPKADNVHLPLIEDFNQAIRGNHEPRISGVEGMKTSVLLDAAYLAAREGKGVTFASG
ncbi:MAG TPA: Gfo/Idh/MocA family oxidoreductase [Terriglobia bacterium]|nr:Gfo/Idh/MocA family oxidoreductase [Terriglobia bacterium]